MRVRIAESSLEVDTIRTVAMVVLEREVGRSEVVEFGENCQEGCEGCEGCGEMGVSRTGWLVG